MTLRAASRWPSVYAALLLAAALWLWGSQFLPVLAPLLWASLLLGGVALTCAGVGERILSRLLGPGQEPGRTPAALTLGLGVLCLALTALAAADLLKPWPVAVCFAAAWAAGYPCMREQLRELASWRFELSARALGAAALAGVPFFLCALPPHLYDALVYHMELASLYVRHGGLVAPANLPYAYFPQNGELLFSLALLLHSQTLAHLFSWLAVVLSVLWVFAAARRGASRAAWPAAFLILTHSAVLCLASVSYVDTLVMLWVTAAVLSFQRWRQERAILGWLALSAFFCGVGFGTKYTVGVCPAILFLFLLVERPSWKTALLFAGVAATAGSPWLIRNWIAVGNPVFPFLYKYLPYRGVAWTPRDASTYFGILTEYGWGKRHWLYDLIRLPWQALTGSFDFGGGADVVGEIGWAPLLLAIPAAIAWGRKKPGAGFALLYCAFHLAAWYSTRIMLRFLTAIVPLAAWPAAEGLVGLWDALETPGRRVAGAALGCLLALNLGLYFYVETVFEPWAVLLGSETRTAYLSRRLEYYPCARWAKEHLGQNDKILLVGEQRGYYVEQEHAITSMTAENGFVLEADAAADPARLARALAADGFTDLLLVPREAKRLAEGFRFTDKGAQNWAGLAPYLRTEFDAGSCRLYSLNPPHG